MSLEEKEEMKEHLRNKLYRTANEIRLYIKDKFGINYSEYGVVKLLHKLGFVYKKTTLIPSGFDEEKQTEWIE